MKKSELYHMAQIAVVSTPSISPERKLEILRVLQHDEDMEVMVEEHNANKAVEE